MRQNPQQSRQYLACAYEPRVEGARAWQHEGYTGPSPEACPGYTTKLPEVIEASEARFYLHNGSLSLLVDDELSDGLRSSIAILETEDNSVMSWIANQGKK